MAYTIYAIVQGVSAVLTYICLNRLLQYGRLSKEYKLLLVVLSFIFIYNVCGTLEVYAQGEETALILLKMRILCIGQILLYMFKFIRNYCKVIITKWIPISYWILNAVIIATVCQSEKNTFYFKSIDFVWKGKRGYLTYEPGMGHHLYTFFTMSLGVLMFGIICCSFWKKKRKWNSGNICMILSVLVPFVGGIVHFLKIFTPFNPTGIILFLAVELLIVSTYQYGMLDVIDGAKDRIIDTMNQALIIVDENKKFLAANQKAKQMYPVLAELEPGDVLKIPKGLGIDENAPEFEFKQNGHYYEGQITPVFDNGILLGFLACIFDITERQHYMEQLVIARNEADRANHAKSRFLSNISHELRTPLNVIIGISSLELRKKNLEEETRFDLQSIYYSGQNLLSLVNNLLDISKIEAEKLVIEQADYSFDSLLYETANTIFTSLRERNIEFKVLVEETVPKNLIGDAVRVRGILTNLLGNAVKYTKEGHIYLKVFWRTDEEKDSGYLYFIVEDTGVGIKPEKLDSIFDEYEQINSAETKGITGTGLGLSIAKQLIELMGGEIHVKSRYGKGSTFEAYVKQGVKGTELVGRKIITQDNIMDLLEKDRSEKEKIECFPDQRILIVDDMEVNCTVLKGVLEPYQLQIDTAVSGKEAVQMVQEREYNLIFMDQMMPEMDGLETLRAIRSLPEKKCGMIPIVLVTANVMTAEEKQLDAQGFQEYLTKPLNMRKLVRVLKKWLRTEKDTYEDFYEGSFEEEDYTELELEMQDAESGREGVGKLQKLDRAEGLRHVGGKEELYQEVLKAYHHDGTKALWQFEKADELKTDELRILAHGIKGSSYNIGAMALGNEAEQIELALKKGDKEYAIEHLPSMTEHLEEILSMLPMVLEENKEEPEEKEKKEIDEGFIQNLKMLKNELENYNMAEIEGMLAELSRFDYGQDVNEKLEQLKNCIEDVEYEAGAELLEQWINHF